MFGKRKTKNDEVRRGKVAYIRGMTAIVNSYADLTDDYEIAQKIKKLASDFQYSDPMSHESLAGKESQIADKVAQLEGVIASGDEEDIDRALKEISSLLKVRNALCANLK